MQNYRRLAGLLLLCLAGQEVQIGHFCSGDRSVSQPSHRGDITPFYATW